MEKYHYLFEKNPVNIPGAPIKVWAKCDMIATVRVDRLERIKVSKGEYKTEEITPAELAALKDCIKYSLAVV